MGPSNFKKNAKTTVLAVGHSKPPNTKILPADVKKAKTLLDEGLDQQATLLKLKSYGMGTKEAMNAIQKALSHTFAETDEPSVLSPEENTGNKEERSSAYFRSSLYLHVCVQNKLANVRLEHERNGVSKILCRAFNISGQSAFQPTLRYRPKLTESSHSKIIVSFGQQVVIETEFDLEKEFFPNVSVTGLGLWAGIQGGSESGLLEVEKVSFRGRSIPVGALKETKAEQKSIKQTESFPSMFRQNGTNITCVYGGVKAPTNIVQPCNEEIALQFDIGVGPFHKDAWVGMYVPGAKNGNFIKHVPLDDAQKMLSQKGTFRVAKKNCWIEFRMFRDVSSSTPIAVSGAYFFSNKKVGMPLSSEQLATQTRLEKLITSKISVRQVDAAAEKENGKATTSTYLESLAAAHVAFCAKPGGEKNSQSSKDSIIWDTTVGEINLQHDTVPSLAYTAKGHFLHFSQPWRHVEAKSFTRRCLRNC